MVQWNYQSRITTKALLSSTTGNFSEDSKILSVPLVEGVKQFEILQKEPLLKAEHKETGTYCTMRRFTYKTPSLTFVLGHGHLRRGKDWQAFFCLQEAATLCPPSFTYSPHRAMTLPINEQHSLAEGHLQLQEVPVLHYSHQGTIYPFNLISKTGDTFTGKSFFNNPFQGIQGQVFRFNIKNNEISFVLGYVQRQQAFLNRLPCLLLKTLLTLLSSAPKLRLLVEKKWKVICLEPGDPACSDPYVAISPPPG